MLPSRPRVAGQRVHCYWKRSASICLVVEPRRANDAGAIRPASDATTLTRDQILPLCGSRRHVASDARVCNCLARRKPPTVRAAPPLLHGTDLKIARGRACRSALCLIRYGPLSIVVWREGARILRALERVQLVRRSALPIALRQGGLYAKGRICRPDIKRSFDSRNCFDPVACRDAMVGTANEVNKSAQAILVTVPPGRYVMSRGLPDDQAQ
jgi:hypothetical protein